MCNIVKKALLRNDLEKRHIVEIALKDANALLSVFRTEERRRVSVFMNSEKSHFSSVL